MGRRAGVAMPQGGTRRASCRGRAGVPGVGYNIRPRLPSPRAHHTIAAPGEGRELGWMLERAGSSRRKRLVCAAGVVALWGMGGEVAGQDRDIQRRVEHLLRQPDQESRLRVDTTLSLRERATVDVGGFTTFSAVNLNDDTGNSRRLLQYDTAVYAQVSIDNVHTFFGRARFRYQDFSPGDSFDERGDEWKEPFLDRYWYEFDLREWRAA